MLEQAHRLRQRRVHPGLGGSACSTAPRTLQGDEALPRLRNGQLERVAKGNVLAQNRVIKQRFGEAASRELTTLFSHSHEFLQHNPWSNVWVPLTPPLSRRERVKRVRVQANSNYAPVSFACKAWRTFSEVTGRSGMLTPTASSTALTIAGATAPIGCSPMDLPP